MKYKRRRLLVLKRKHIKIIIIVLAVAIAATVLLLVTSANTRRSEKQHAVDTVCGHRRGQYRLEGRPQLALYFQRRYRYI